MRSISRRAFGLWRLAIAAALVTPIAAAHAAPNDTSGVQVLVEPGSGDLPVVRLIDRARKSVRVEVYILTDANVIRALGAVRRRGVDVRVLLEEHPLGGQGWADSAYAKLRGAGVPVRWANERSFALTHEKMIEVDGQVAGIFTFNLSYSAFSRNREFGIIDRSGGDARALAAIFSADWSRQAEHLDSNRLVVSPDNSRRALQGLIDRASKTLDVYAEELGDSSVERHLRSAVRRGVRVRLVTSASSAGVQAVQQAGVSVRILQSPYIHAKAIVADGRTLYVGSENLSTASLDRNREAGIILNDRSAAGVIERTFSRDWGETVPPSRSTHNGALPVRVSALPSSVKRGEPLTIEVQTDPGAVCGIRVTYPDGYVSKAHALAGTETATPSGSVSWTWRVGSTVTGIAQATVHCTLGSSSGTGSTTFRITD